MNMPGFTAETSLYKSNATYQLDSSCGKVLMQDVTLQFPLNWPEVRCRVACYGRFRNNDNRLRECLNEC